MSAVDSQWSRIVWSGVEGRVRLARLLIYAALILLVWQFARLVLLAMSGPGVPPVTVPPLPSLRDVSTASAQGLERWHLFGEAPATLDLNALAALPDTPLALTLHGIVAATRNPAGGAAAGDAHEGYALIADERGREEVYRRGDQVPGGAEVLSIEHDQVVLQRNGQRETLRLPGARAAARSGTGTAVNTRTAAVPGTAATQPAVNALPGIRAPRGPVTISTAVPQLPGLRVDAGALAKMIQVAPVSGGGFRVFPGRNAQIFNRLGLRANDVVTQVNGKPLNSQADATAIFQQVQRGEPVAITVRRGDREVTLKPDLNALINQ